MMNYFLSLDGLERVLLVVGALGLSTLLVNLIIERIERTDRGVAGKRGGALTVTFVMSGACVFSFLSLFLLYKGFVWYVAYPVGILAALCCMLVGLLFGGEKTGETGNDDYDAGKAIGHLGVVYRTVLPDIPTGCVSVDVFGRTLDAFAISSNENKIAVGTIVKIIDADGNILVCLDVSDEDNVNGRGK